jgi:AAA family ATP:ADP antiporter
MHIIENIKKILWPIERNELKKFIPMAFMMLCILFNYNALRSLKDSLVVSIIGAEAVSFIKLYMVVPFSLMLAILYAKLVSIMKLPNIFYSFCVFFLSFFLLFGLVLYPNQDAIHPSAEFIEKLQSKTIDFPFFSFSVSHFKWFIKIYSKWLYVIFYIIAELWGSAMIFLSFWQFANYITKTNEAKRFYPMFGFIGNIGLVLAGTAIKYIYKIQKSIDLKLAMVSDKAEFVIAAVLVLSSISVVFTMIIYHYIQNKVLTDPQCYEQPEKKRQKPKLSLSESFKLIISSRYLGYIVVLLLCYGITVSLVEGAWKAKARELYPTVAEYANFMGDLSRYTGAVSMLFMIIGTNILTRCGWLFGALATPVMILITGTGFFILVVFDDILSKLIVAYMFMSPLYLTFLFGFVQNVLSKATKYSLFDPTKEMAYIPIDIELQTKGKAAVDVVGARIAKSGGAFIQSTLFMILPNATYSDISPILMFIFILICIIWIVNANNLYKEYKKLV